MAGICRKTNKLFAPFRLHAEALLREAKAVGLPLEIFETWRTKERQRHLFKIGTSRIRTVGMHSFGLACDYVFRVNGRWTWDEPEPLMWKCFGDLVREGGFIWGGDWGWDSAHVQYIPNRFLKQLRKGNYSDWKLVLWHLYHRAGKDRARLKELNILRGFIL